MNRFPVPLTGLPALEPLLNGNLWQEWAAERRVFPLADLLPAIRYIRLKPNTSCRLAVFGTEGETATDPPPGFLLHLYPDPERARVAFEKESYRRSHEGEGVFESFLCERLGVVAVPFPNDPKIPGLRHIYRPHRLRNALSELLLDYPSDRWKIRRSLTRKKLLAYKPGRRAVYRIEAKIERLDGDQQVSVPFHVKLETPATYERSYENLVAIHSAVAPNARWRVPKPQGKVASRSMVATEWIEGRPLRETLADPSAALRAFRLTGRALAGFHQLSSELADLPCLTEEGASLRDLGRDLVLLLPQDRERILDLAGRLSRSVSELPSEPRTTVHGDFHLGQVLLNGGRPVVVDLDRAARGHAVFDLGSFLAHLLECEARPEIGEFFLSGYVEDGGTRFDRELLSLATAVGAFRRTAVPFRCLMVDWPARIRKRLDQVEELLGGR